MKWDTKGDLCTESAGKSGHMYIKKTDYTQARTGDLLCVRQM